MELITIEDITNIVGVLNRFIRSQICSECGEQYDVLVEVGQTWAKDADVINDEPDTAYVCEECLEKALNLIRNSGGE